MDGFVTVTMELFKSQESEQLVGTVFEGRYRIDGVLGHGGMGTVYRGTQLNVDRGVAIKLINAERAKDMISLKRFQLEARLIAKLNHPNIIQLIDFGAPDDRHIYLVMELVEGKSLAQSRVPGSPMHPERVMHIAEQILEGLADAHELGIVHRDLKPTNIMLTHYGEQADVVKILDFGVATNPEDDENSPRLTRAGVTVGSPMYMPPEQAAGLEITGKADIYSLGAIMYELLTGRPPFRCHTNREYMTAHVHAPVPAPMVDGRPASGPLVDFILSCLQKAPEARPDDARHALDLLRACHDAPMRLGTAEPRRRAAPANVAPASVITIDATGSVSAQPVMLQPATETHARLSTIDELAAAGKASATASGSQPTTQPRRDPRPVVLVADRRKPTPWGPILGTLTAAALVVVAVLAFSPGADSGDASAEQPAVKAPPVEQNAAAPPGPAPAVGTPSAPPDKPVDPSPSKKTAEAERPDVVPDKPPVDAAPERLSVDITSDPPGASVLANGQPIGDTPVTLAWPKDDKMPAVAIRQSGFKQERFVLGHDDLARGSRHVKMRRLKSARRPLPLPPKVDTTPKAVAPKPAPKEASPAKNTRSYKAMP